MSTVTCPACNFVNEGDDLRHCSKCGGFLPAAPTADAADSMVGQVILNGKYRIISIIGEGGMGKVYLAEQKLGTATRKVAIKTLQPDLAQDPQIIARFHRETQTVIELEHPNTIKFYDFGELEDHGKKLFVVMEFIQGESLAHRLARGSLDAAATERIMAQVCGSLAEAHEKGIVHRDLKPENIYLTQKGARGDFVKVLDFGIAKRNEAQDEKEAKLTRQGMVLGTPPYMSPEQFTGQLLDGRSDVYALGIIAYEMLTGALPFTANTPWEWATKHLTAPPIPIESQQNGHTVNPKHRAAILHALEKNRDQRPKTVIEFLQEFTGDSAGATDWTASSTSLTNSGNRQPANTPSPIVAPTMASPMSNPGPGPGMMGNNNPTNMHPANTPNPFNPQGPGGQGVGPSPSNAGFAAVPPSMPQGSAGSNPSFPSPMGPQGQNPFGAMPSSYGQSGVMNMSGVSGPSAVPAQPPKSNTGIVVGLIVGLLVVVGGIGGAIAAFGGSGESNNPQPTSASADPTAATAAYPTGYPTAYPTGYPTAAPTGYVDPTTAAAMASASAAMASASAMMSALPTAFPTAYPSATAEPSVMASAQPTASATAAPSASAADDDDDDDNNNNNGSRPTAAAISPAISNGLRMVSSGALEQAINVLQSNDSAPGAARLRSAIRTRGGRMIQNYVLNGQCPQAAQLYGRLRNVGASPAGSLLGDCN